MHLEPQKVTTGVLPAVDHYRPFQLKHFDSIPATAATTLYLGPVPLQDILIPL